MTPTTPTALAGTNKRLGYPTYPQLPPPTPKLMMGPAPAEAETIREQIPIVAAAVAKNLGEAVKILTSPRAMFLARDLEKIAKKLSQTLLVGDIPYLMLRSRHAVPEDFGMLDKGKRSLVQYLTFEELGRIEMLEKLQRGELDELIASRSGYSPPPQTEELKRRFLSGFSKLKGLLALMDLSESAMTNISIRIRDEITDPILKERLLYEFSFLSEISLFMEHDMFHCFGSKLLEGELLWEKNTWGPTLASYLTSFCHLTAHLRHLSSVLIVNKFRADQTMPAPEMTSLAEVVNTAARAIGFRLHLPINHTAEFLINHVNLHLDLNINIVTIPAFLENILYQLTKNSLKAVLEAFKDSAKSGLKVDITLKRDKQSPNVIIITVEDNAIGFQINRILAEGFALAKKMRRAGAVFDKNSLMEKLLKWEEEPAIARTFTVGEIIDLTFMQKLSGFGTTSFSSGLGLDEVAKMAQWMGADVLMTNTVNGGALTSIIIGPQKEREQVIARKLGIT